MGTVAGIGKSAARDAERAGRDAAVAASAALGGKQPTFCMAFATSGYDQGAVLAGVRDATGGAPLAGCSGEGVIVGAESHESDRMVAVMAIHSCGIEFEPMLVRDYTTDSRSAARALAAAVRATGTEDLLGVLVFPDGLNGNCDAFLRTLHQELPVGVQVVGGTAGDDMAFLRTYQYCNDEAVSNAVSAVIMRGKGEMSIAVSHGCTLLGLERTVTRAEDGWLYEIDGQPAWSVFKEYLDGDPEDLNADGIIHLCIGEPLDAQMSDDYGRYIIRTPLRLDKDNGALFFPGGGLNAGQPIRLTRRDPGKIRQSARAAADRVLDVSRGRRPAFVLQFDCAGRGKVLFGSDAADEIIRPMQNALGLDTPWIGFHTYGEIAPIGGRGYYHNYTVALCAVFDDA